MLEHALIWAGGAAAIVAAILIAARAFGIDAWQGKGSLIAIPFIVFVITFSQNMGRHFNHTWLWVLGGAMIAAVGGSLISRVAR